MGKQTKKFTERILEAYQIDEKAGVSDKRLSFQERCRKCPEPVL